jgi:hypothetical protein
MPDTSITDAVADALPPPIDAPAAALEPVAPPPGSPDFERKQGRASESKTSGGAPAPAASPLVAALDFVDERGKTIKLDHPFRLDGRLIEAIEVRRLPLQALSALVSSGRHTDLYEVYAEMAGLPAAVLRGLDADDGVKVTEAAWDFLPLGLREAHAAP